MERSRRVDYDRRNAQVPHQVSDGHQKDPGRHHTMTFHFLPANLPLVGANAEHVDAIAARAAAIKRLRNIISVNVTD